MRIETGYGARVFLTDAVSSVIIRESILPRFKAGDMAGGIIAGADQIIKMMSLSPAEAQKYAADASKQEQARANAGSAILPAFFWVLIAVFVLLSLFRRAAGRRYRRQKGGISPWIVLWGLNELSNVTRGAAAGVAAAAGAAAAGSAAVAVSRAVAGRSAAAERREDGDRAPQRSRPRQGQRGDRRGRERERRRDRRGRDRPQRSLSRRRAALGGPGADRRIGVGRGVSVVLAMWLTCCWRVAVRSERTRIADILMVWPVLSSPAVLLILKEMPLRLALTPRDQAAACSAAGGDGVQAAAERRTVGRPAS